MYKLLKIFFILLVSFNFASAKGTIKGEVVKIEIEDKKHITTVKFTNENDGSPVTPDQLKTFHTEKIHLLIIDDSLSDYSHIHPTPSNEAGEYEFEWYPKKMAKYKIWADILPEATNEPEYVVITLENKVAQKGKIDRTTHKEVKTSNLNFKIDYSPSTLKSRKDGIITVKISDKNGEPFTELEPIMGAFAHLVAFSEDFKTIAHVHPMGNEPEWFWENGGPELSFHITPPKKGFYKFFLQIKVNGEEKFIPFGALIK